MGNFMQEYIEKYKDFPCPCGREHATPIHDVIIGSGVIAKLGEVVKKYDANKVFIIADINTKAAAGKKVYSALNDSGISYSEYIFKDEHLEPDEKAVGSAIMHFDYSCDMIVAIGSGVINDISKIVAKALAKPYVIVATAPSMDGYASDTSSMALNGLKVSIPSGAANVIIGDIDIIKDAPMHLLKSGLGDMLAKYISICEWKIAKLLIGEYYCDTVAELINTALKNCVDNAEGLLKRDKKAVEAVFEGLIIGGVAMNFAKVSRPASGMEHYISHVWDMRGLALGTPIDTHGVQCAIGTLYVAKLYEKLVSVTPDKEKALEYVSQFDVEGWYGELSEFMGSGADSMIELDKKEQKYDKAKHAARLELIIGNWDEIVGIIKTLPSSKEIEAILDKIECPKSIEDIGLSKSILPMTVKASKDIRDKYVCARLLWDLGILDEYANSL